jgi:hypothetical protein
VIVHDVLQRSPEWYQLRCGRLCASDVADVFANGRGSSEAVSRRDLRLALACERLTGRPQESDYLNAAMQRGIECEAAARLAYESLTGNLVTEVGFVTHDTLLAGCSPDGEIDGFTRLVEIKAPKSATHLDYLRIGKVPPKYLPQLTCQLWLTGAEAVDFFSWDDRFPPALQTFLVTVKRSDVDLAAFELAVTLFLSEVEKEVEAVSRLVGSVVAA